MTQGEGPYTRHWSLDQDLGNPGLSGLGICTTLNMIVLYPLLLAHPGFFTAGEFRSSFLEED